ncbi:uncharacterized protein LOC124162670 [Ischnura elegans]|uniref:uncharacterized protein LOC124162670 n=1 Tax=Ischnura elegans TaxID=197161 RepID=UPI001ED876DD|nr:uncharacterized protein LOC124162670 [Ischnura elegans]
MPKTTCAVAGCSSRKVDGMHRFPMTVERAEMWRRFCQSPALANIPANVLHARVQMCKLHFCTTQFQTSERIKLNRNAVPTLFPPSSLDPVSTPDVPVPPTNDLSTPPHHMTPPPLPCSVDSSSTNLVFSTPGTSAPHRLSLNFTPISTSPITSREGCSAILRDSSPSLEMMEDEVPTLNCNPTSSFVTESSRSADVSKSSEILATPLSSSAARKGGKRSILFDLGMTRVNQLTPRKKIMYKRLVNQRRQINRWRKLVTKKSNFSDLNPDSRLMKAIEKNLSPSAVTFLSTLLREGQKKPKGRRWTHELKVKALSIFKKSPRAYTFLRNFLPIPCRKTLTKLLSSFPFTTGINPTIFNLLTTSAQRMEERDRHCCLLFDEMSLKKELVWDRVHDHIAGYEDHGSGRRREVIAEKALVFMVRGLWSKWKCPVAYYFSNGAVTSTSLQHLIQEVLHHLMRTGLKIVATVCDMATTNVRALQLLGASFDEPSFEFEGKTVVTIFDPPHLLKCVRNLFWAHDFMVPVTIGGNVVMMRASWSHVRAVYDDDGQNPCGRLFKLTENHLSPEGYLKMRVFLAAQVFSLHVSRGVGALVGRAVLPTAALGTAELLLLMNNLFDSMNGDKAGAKRIGSSSMYRVPMTARSHHLETFRLMEEKIRALKMFKGRGVAGDHIPPEWRPKYKGKKVPPPNAISGPPPSIMGWIATLRGITMLWERVGSRYGHMNTRSLNQDPIENLFNLVRQNCGCNRTPNASQFVSALKTAVINGLVITNSRGNCEIDDCSSLSGLNELFSGDNEDSSSLLHEEYALGLISVANRTSPKMVKLSAKEMQSVAVVAQHVARTVLKDNTCNLCSSCLLTDNPDPCNLFLEMQRGDHEPSQCPTEELVVAVGEGITWLLEELPVRGHEERLSHKMEEKLSQKVNFSFILCEIHGKALQANIVKCIVIVGIEKYIRIVNRE